MTVTTNPHCLDGGPDWSCVDGDGTGLWCDSCLSYAGPKSEPSVQFLVRMPDSLREALREEAQRQDLTMAQFVRRAIVNELARDVAVGAWRERIRAVRR